MQSSSWAKWIRLTRVGGLLVRDRPQQTDEDGGIGDEEGIAAPCCQVGPRREYEVNLTKYNNKWTQALKGHRLKPDQEENV